MSSAQAHLRFAFHWLLAAAWSHYVFVAGMILKGFDGVLELASGLFVLTTSPAALHALIARVTAGELREDPNSRVAHYLLHIGGGLSSHAKWGVACYLSGHGLLKLFLVVSLLRHRRWAFPVALAVLLGFIGLQSFLLVHRFSPELALATALDGVVVLLVWMEFKRSWRGSGVTAS